MKKRMLILTMMMASGIACSHVFAATIRVPQDQPTIQAGINSAVNGDTVLVADGTYTGTGNKEIEYFGKAITVMSENGPEMCIIDCENSGRGFYFRGGEGNGSVLDGLTIRNGYVSGGYISNRGGGIRIGGASSPVIRNCVITQNEATGSGSGVYIANSATRQIWRFLPERTAPERWSPGVRSCATTDRPPRRQTAQRAPLGVATAPTSGGCLWDVGRCRASCHRPTRR